MKLHEPFMISARLAPALRIGDRWDGTKVVPGTAWLSLVKTGRGCERRARCTFALDTPEFEYEDDSMQTGNGTGWGVVEVFETFLSFLLAAVESREYRERTGRQGENEDIFPAHVVDWACDHKSDLENLYCELTDDDGNIRKELVEEGV